MRHYKYAMAEVNASSMADIAFLLLTFFLITTVIKNEKGLMLLLPPLPVDKPVDIQQRNMFSIHINSHDQYLVEGLRRTSLNGLKSEIKKFILNKGQDKTLSDDPRLAVVSLKADRGTSHQAFINALDEIQGAYYEIYAERAGISTEQFRVLNQSVPGDKALYDRARDGLPMNISIAEPSAVK